ncbi:MAG: phosphatidyl-myo-inositol dimannoside synthase [Acidimicrobiaceae bacterium]|nr:phosphatidyl-myo-inositol dimannoside synthase [Acidimicrobiaceae bacterium]
MTHVLVTNDFPPKVGGIQSYLWELWRRLPLDPPDRVTVLTTPYQGASSFDRRAPFAIQRTTAPVLLPQPGLVARVDRLAADAGAKLVVLDPALPLGLIGPYLSVPYAVVLHGAEITVPARLPGTRQALQRVVGGAALLIAAGDYPAADAARLLRLDRPANAETPPIVNVPPGVDTARFRPLSPAEKSQARARLGLPTDDGAQLVVSVSRLVPRKGMDALIDAAARLRPTHPRLTVAIAGSGRDRSRLERLASATDAPVQFLGRVPEDDLPALYGCADVFAMLCRNRWLGLEQEGFGIVFMEAAACGVPQVAGDSGGAADAVVDHHTGLVVRDPTDPVAVADALARLLDDPPWAAQLGRHARPRALEEFDYSVLAARLDAALAEHGG